MNEDHKDVEHGKDPLTYHNGTARPTMHEDPCYVQRAEFESYKREVDKTCELHRKELELLVERKCVETGDYASDDLEKAVCARRTEMNEGLGNLKSDITSSIREINSRITTYESAQNLKWDEYHKSQKEFNRNLIITLVGLIVTSIVGFISLWVTAGGHL